MTIEAGISPDNPLDYLGITQNVVPCGWFRRDPTTADTNYPGMFIWGNELTGNIFIRTNTASVWDQMAEGSGGTTVPEGGTGRVTLTDHAVLVGSGVDPIDFVGPSAVVGQVLQSAGAAADPAFSTATYPATTTINQVLYSSAANVVGGLATANNGTFVTSAAGVPSVLAGPGTTGQVLQANAAAAPSFSNTSYPSTSALGDVMYASAVNTFTDLAFVATATRYLANTGGAATVPAWDQINLANGVTGTLPVANGGTGAVTLTDHALVVGSGTAAVDFVGPSATVGQVLQSAGAAADPTFSTATYPATTTINQILYSSAANVVGELTTANNGTLVTSAAGVPSVLAGPGTTGNILQSNAAAAPSFSTATYPVTTAQGDLLLSSAANTITALAKDATATRYLSNTGVTNNAAWAQVVLTDGVTGTLPVANGGTGIATATQYAVICGGAASGTAPFQPLASVGTTGQVLTSNGAAMLPTWQNSSFLEWTEIAASQGALVDEGYYTNGGGQIVLTLPAVSAQFTQISVVGNALVNSWRIAQNAGQQIFFASASTTVGVGGYIESSTARNTITLICIVANLSWEVRSSTGILTVV